MRYLYLSSDKVVKNAEIKADGLLGLPSTRIYDLPEESQYIKFGPDGVIYISVGNSCNNWGETNDEHATLLQVKPDGTSGRIFARGLRNTTGFEWHPETKELWGADHGTDWRGDEVPHEELNKITDGTHYGWRLLYDKQNLITPVKTPRSNKSDVCQNYWDTGNFISCPQYTYRFYFY